MLNSQSPTQTLVREESVSSKLFTWNMIEDAVLMLVCAMFAICTLQ